MRKTVQYKIQRKAPGVLLPGIILCAQILLFVGKTRTRRKSERDVKLWAPRQ